jgi:hypothetical protein
MNLRKEARGRDCLVRIPGVCKNNRDTTVLAHINERSLVGAGMGQKVPDIFGAHSCSDCHDVLDRRFQSVFTPDELLIMHYQGMIRTIILLIDEGKIKT